jgi:hypothetical protein
MDYKRTPPDDTFQIRCPRLGNQIYFSYCRGENFGLPCGKILNCWYRYFDVENYLRSELSPQEFNRLFCVPPKSRVQSLMDMIAEAQKRAGKGDE